MLHEVAIAGVYFPPLVLDAVLAAALFVPVRVLLGRVVLARLVWHPALFELALYVSLVAVIVLLSPGG